MLRKKTLLIVGSTLLGLIALLYLTFNGTLLRGFLALEDEDARLNVNRLVNYINSQMSDLDSQVQDWAHWDDTYDFAINRNLEYIEANVFSETFRNLRVNLMVYTNVDNEIVYSAAHDIVIGQPMPIPSGFRRHLGENPLLVESVDGIQGTAGILVVDNLPMIVASSPILDSNMNGSPRGTLIWGRYLDAAHVRELSEFMRVPITLKRYNDPALPADFVLALQQLSAGRGYAQPVDANIIAGYGLLNDIYGQPALLLRLDMPREIYQQGRLSLEYFLFSLVIAGVVFMAVTLLLLERMVLSRLYSLSSSVHGIARVGLFSKNRVYVSGSDELADLGRAINTMLDTLALSQQSLRQLNTELEARVEDRTAELASQKSFLEAILDSMNDGVIYGTDDRIEYVNRMMAQMCGYEEAELVGQSNNFLFTLPVTAERGGLESRDTRWVLRGERKLRCKDGTQIDIAYTITPLKGFVGESKNIYIIRDVTEEKAQQARRDRFLDNAAHELRTPLTNLITRLYLLRRQPEHLLVHLEILDSVTAHMKTLVEDLLDVSRFKRGTLPLRRQRIQVQSLIAEAVLLQHAEAARKEIVLTAHLPETPVEVDGDPKRLFQVLTNLIVNAINYTPRGGHVDIELELEHYDTAHFALIRVRDDGIGMDAQTLSQVFEPFFRANNSGISGTGLGLAIVKEIVEQHNGVVIAQSETGHGSAFTVRLKALTADTQVEDVP